MEVVIIGICCFCSGLVVGAGGVVLGFIWALNCAAREESREEDEMLKDYETFNYDGKD